MDSAIASVQAVARTSGEVRPMTTFTHGVESLFGDNEHRSIGAIIMDVGHYLQVTGEYLYGVRYMQGVGLRIADIAQSLYRYADNRYARDFSMENGDRGVMAVLAVNGRWYVQCYMYTPPDSDPVLHHEYPARNYSDAWEWGNAWCDMYDYNDSWIDAR